MTKERSEPTPRAAPAGPRRYAAVVVAAGRGTRAGPHADGPKQYRRLAGIPVIVHSLRRLCADRRVTQSIVVIHPDDETLLSDALAHLPSENDIIVVHGGEQRQLSVLHGLRAVDPARAGYVLIHDAARPFVSAALLDRIDAAFADGAEAVLPATPLTDTIKRADSEGHVHETVPRAGLFAAQTPQAFALDGILRLHQAAAAESRFDYTDDAAIAERGGMTVRLVEGDADNIKLTRPEDFRMAEERLRAIALPDVRTGNGYDVHRLVPGDGVTLCGVFIPHDQALDGHSDADVALHALTDALLATCGAGDIGDHFPPSDPQWKGAASRIFLAHAAGIVRAAGGTIMNADVSLIAEAPKIGPHRHAMRAFLADVLGIAIERCSVKATTNETIGFVGRREGIAAIATATVVYGGETR